MFIFYFFKKTKENFYLFFILATLTGIFNPSSGFSQVYVQYNAYTSMNIDGFRYGWGTPNMTMGLETNLFQVAFFGIRLHSDLSYFHFLQENEVFKNITINSEEVFSNIKKNLIERKKVIQNIKLDLRFIEKDKFDQYKEDFFRKLFIQYQYNMYDYFRKILESAVPKGPSSSDIFKTAISDLFKGLSKSIETVTPILSVIPGAGQVAAAVAPIASSTLGVISGFLDASISQSVKPDTPAYKAGEIISSIPGIYFIGAIIKAIEMEKLRKRLNNIRNSMDQTVRNSEVKYRDLVETQLESLKKEIEDFKGKDLKSISYENRYDFIAKAKVVVEHETKESMKKAAESTAIKQVEAEVGILKRRLEKEEKDIDIQVQDITKKESFKEAEESLRISYDKYMRTLFAMGPTFYFKFFGFLVPYIETSFLLSFDYSYQTQIKKIRVGMRFGTGLQFEFFQGRFFFGFNFRYWLIHNRFFTIGPRIGFKI